MSIGSRFGFCDTPVISNPSNGEVMRTLRNGFMFFLQNGDVNGEYARRNSQIDTGGYS